MVKFKRWFHNNVCCRLIEKPFKYIGSPYVEEAFVDRYVSAFRCKCCGIEVYKMHNTETNKFYGMIKQTWNEKIAIERTS